MRAARLHAFGFPLQIDDVPEPVARKDQELLATRFIGVNPVDVWLTNGDVAGGRQRLPFVPGTEATGLINGTPVLVHGMGLGVSDDGLYAELAAVPHSAVTTLPLGVDLAEAAALGVPGSTAWLLVHDVACLTADDRVLVLGASGGVGSVLVQLARRAGALVWGQTSSPEKLDFVRSFAPEGAVVASAEHLPKAVSQLAPTVVFDALGDGYTDASIRALQPSGRIVLYGTSVDPRGRIDLRNLYKKGVQLRSYSSTLIPGERIQEAIAAVLAELAAGTVRPFVQAIIPLEDVQKAHQRLRGHEIRGKLLLQS